MPTMKKNELTYAQLMKKMREKDFDDSEITIDGMRLASDAYDDEAEQSLRASTAYLKKISDISSELASGLVAG